MADAHGIYSIPALRLIDFKVPTGTSWVPWRGTVNFFPVRLLSQISWLFPSR